ncbi:hypothetical protein HDU76_001230 [Blyttiomyces sp. JEL0837]|nr:hypothetical protein HDU76_001230 [Blyttiomyces sp. JEL0837]
MMSSKTNVTLALILPYAIVDYTITPVIDLFDAGAELAVNEINQDDILLPDIFINLARYNSRDPEHAYDLNVLMSPGGYTAVTAMEVASQRGKCQTLLGALGEYSSKSAGRVSQVLGQYQVSTELLIMHVPFGRNTIHIEITSRLADSILWNYPRKVAIVIGPDQRLIDISKDMINSFVRGGVKVLTVLYLRESQFLTHDYALLYKTLTDVDARYIIIIHDLDETADFYYRSKPYGLLNPEHLWFGFNPPVPTSVDITTEYGSDAINDFQGFVSFFPDIPYFTDPTIQAFNNSWARMTEKNSTKYPPLGFLDTLYAGATYDCVKTMAYGIHQLLEKNPSYTAEMLANGSLNHLLTPDKFANTGYRGVLYDPIMLNQYGDLYTPSLFFALNNSLWYDLPQDRTTAFGVTDLNGSEYFTLQNTPVFYGGGSIPPPDGPIPDRLEILANSTMGIVLYILGAIGLLFTLTALLFVIQNRAKRNIRGMSPVFTILFLAGSALAYTSLFFNVGPVETSGCLRKTWLLVMALPLTYGVSVVKNFRVYAIFFLAKRARWAHKDVFLFILQGGIVAITVALLIWWSKTVEVATFVTSDDRVTKTLQCGFFNASDSKNDNMPAYIILALAGFLFILTGILSFYTTLVYDHVNESLFLWTSFALGCAYFIAEAIVTFDRPASILNMFYGNVAIWAITSLNLFVLFYRKVKELYGSKLLHRVVMASRSRSNITSSSSRRSTRLSQNQLSHSRGNTQLEVDTALLQNGPIRDNILHLSLGTVTVRYETWSPFPAWREGGIILFKTSSIKFIVFDLAEEAISWPIAGAANIKLMETHEGDFIVGFVTDVNGTSGTKAREQTVAYFEFENENRLNAFLDAWGHFVEA